MWKANDSDSALMQWCAEPRTSTLAERSVMIGADTITGNVMLTAINEDGKPVTVTLPTGAARNIGTALIEGSLIAGQAITR